MSCIITYNGQNFTQEDFLDYLKSLLPNQSYSWSRKSENSTSVQYSDFGTKTASKNVKIDSINGRKPTSNKNEIVAYRGPNTASMKNEGGLIKDLEENRMIGNPFGPYGLVKIRDTEQAVMAFYNWLNGAAYQDKFQNYRQAILNKANEMKGLNIIYYKDLGQPSHATALDYFLNNQPQSVQQSNIPSEIKGIEIVQVENKATTSKPQSKDFITNKVNSSFDKYGYIDILTSGKNNFDFKSAVIKYVLKDLGLEFKSDNELNNYLIKEKNEGRTFNLMQYVTLEELPDNKTRVKLNKRNLLLDSTEDFGPRSLGGLSFTSSGRDFESKNIFKNNIEQAFNCK